MGFSYPSVSRTDDKSIIDRLYDQGKIKNRVGCVKLRLKKESDSQLILGGCDVEADSWIPVLKINDKYTGWRLNLTKVVLRSTADDSELLTVETNNEAVIDTGAGDTVGNRFKEEKKNNRVLKIVLNQILKIYRKNLWM